MWVKKKKSKPSGIKTAENKAWKWFSIWIRLRDADSEGFVKCITSGRRVHWKDCDAGHFISRRHKATKFHEQNTHGQSRHDNRMQYGRQFEYGQIIDQRYGPGTAAKLLALSRQTCKRGVFEYDQMAKHYEEEAKRIAHEKGIVI